ncbi:ATP-binding cassette domain-containing protein [Geomicrobium sediminis]|uniref:D-methionine transport system ATP-binding protein n=1 Tax=Geomicrobium sediminis TaxID=1347788 RepID=A0ABS2P9N7_9BACL|nr:D-methionine transport system ATP-binding protein [Geomicrobium sediminis]
MIRINDVSKVFKTKAASINAVQNVELNIEQGEIFGIIGYSGAGKSTLIRLLNLLEVPSSGFIKIADYDMMTLRGKELRKARQEISMIFQHFNLLWSRTVRQNIAYPLEIAGVSSAKRKERVDELIKLVGLEGRGDAYPSQLSGGQKQRVGIARALANNPKVLLCDEATSALDPKTTSQILDLLYDINQKLGLTIVLITHEMHVIHKICGRVAVMEDGKVVEQGAVLDVFRNPSEEITRAFVKQITENDESLEVIEDQLDDANGTVVKLTFVGERTEKPFVSELIRNVDIDVNILQGNIARTKDGSYGTLFISLEGSEDKVKAALAFLENHEVQAEVITHG